MGQQRTDSHAQIAAKVRGAEARRCKNCQRKNAMSDTSSPQIRAKQCRYCGFARGTDLITGERFEEWPEDA